jgi:hypothetical protein
MKKTFLFDFCLILFFFPTFQFTFFTSSIHFTIWIFSEIQQLFHKILNIFHYIGRKTTMRNKKSRKHFSVISQKKQHRGILKFWSVFFIFLNEGDRIEVFFTTFHWEGSISVLLPFSFFLILRVYKGFWFFQVAGSSGICNSRHLFRLPTSSSLRTGFVGFTIGYADVFIFQ